MQELSNGIASKYEEIVEKIKGFPNENLDKRYKDICILAVESLFLNHKEEVKKGKSFSWGAGIVHAIGSVNNLFDPKEEPYIKVADLYKEFGISSSTGASKSKEVKKLLDISKENSKWLVKKDEIKEESTVTINRELEDEKINNHNIEKAFTFEVSKEYIKAYKIINEAWKQKNYKNKEKYAKQALEIDENCSDAYIILSKNSKLTNEEKTQLLEKAVNSAKKTLKIDSLESADKRLLKLKIAKPLFGAKYILAVHLWKIEKRNLAIDNALEILKYDEKDTLMIRSIVVNWLLIEKKYNELKEILEKYEYDNLAAINYSRVILFFKIKEFRLAENALRKAYRKNPNVIPYILKQKRVNILSIPNLIKIGTEDEANKYFSMSFEVWNDPELVKWIKEKKKEFDIINFN